jgi:hypothetical protein
MKFRAGYKRLVIFWLILVIPVLYYGIPYSGGDITPVFENVAGVIQWLVAVAFLLLPLVSLPFFLKKQDDSDHN